MKEKIDLEASDKLFKKITSQTIKYELKYEDIKILYDLLGKDIKNFANFIKIKEKEGAYKKDFFKNLKTNLLGELFQELPEFSSSQNQLSLGLTFTQKAFKYFLKNNQLDKATKLMREALSLNEKNNKKFKNLFTYEIFRKKDLMESVELWDIIFKLDLEKEAFGHNLYNENYPLLNFIEEASKKKGENFKIFVENIKKDVSNNLKKDRKILKKLSYQAIFALGLEKEAFEYYLTKEHYPLLDFIEEALKKKGEGFKIFVESIKKEISNNLKESLSKKSPSILEKLSYQSILALGLEKEAISYYLENNENQDLLYKIDNVLFYLLNHDEVNQQRKMEFKDFLKEKFKEYLPEKIIEAMLPYIDFQKLMDLGIQNQAYKYAKKEYPWVCEDLLLEASVRGDKDFLKKYGAEADLGLNPPNSLGYKLFEKLGEDYVKFGEELNKLGLSPSQALIQTKEKDVALKLLKEAPKYFSVNAEHKGRTLITGKEKDEAFKKELFGMGYVPRGNELQKFLNIQITVNAHSASGDEKAESTAFYEKVAKEYTKDEKKDFQEFRDKIKKLKGDVDGDEFKEVPEYLLKLSQKEKREILHPLFITKEEGLKLDRYISQKNWAEYNKIMNKAYDKVDEVYGKDDKKTAKDIITATSALIGRIADPNQIYGQLQDTVGSYYAFSKKEGEIDLKNLTLEIAASSMAYGKKDASDPSCLPGIKNRLGEVPVKIKPSLIDEFEEFRKGIKDKITQHNSHSVASEAVPAILGEAEKDKELLKLLHGDSKLYLWNTKEQKYSTEENRKLWPPDSVTKRLNEIFKESVKKAGLTEFDRPPTALEMGFFLQALTENEKVKEFRKSHKLEYKVDPKQIKPLSMDEKARRVKIKTGLYAGQDSVNYNLRTLEKKGLKEELGKIKKGLGDKLSEPRKENKAEKPEAYGKYEVLFPRESRFTEENQKEERYFSADKRDKKEPKGFAEEGGGKQLPLLRKELKPQIQKILTEQEKQKLIDAENLEIEFAVNLLFSKYLEQPKFDQKEELKELLEKASLSNNQNILKNIGLIEKKFIEATQNYKNIKKIDKGRKF